MKTSLYLFPHWINFALKLKSSPHYLPVSSVQVISSPMSCLSAQTPSWPFWIRAPCARTPCILLDPSRWGTSWASCLWWILWWSSRPQVSMSALHSCHTPLMTRLICNSCSLGPGEQIVSALENGVSQWPKLEGRFPQVAGVTFGFDPSKPPGERVIREAVKIQGQKVELDKVCCCHSDSLHLSVDDWHICHAHPAFPS